MNGLRNDPPLGWVEYVSTCDSIILFWKHPSQASLKPLYRVSVDGRAKGETHVTHFTVTGLKGETSHDIRVELVGDFGSVLADRKIRVKTRQSRSLLDVTDAPYGAMGDGSTLNTRALQRAIDDCGPRQAVFIPPGRYLTGALFLHDNVELRLAKGAVLQGSRDPADYLPKISSRFEGVERECYASLLNLGRLDHKGGYNCHDVIIRGQGSTVRGGGKALADAMIEAERDRLEDELADLGGKISEYENEDTIPGRARGRLINISNCQDVLIEGLTLRDGPAWNVHMIYSDQILTADCEFISAGIWNGDGWDPDSSTNCTLFGSQFRTGDDCVAIKSGKNPEGNRIGRPTKNIRIFDCVSEKAHGFAIGSEISGGIDGVYIWDCNLASSMYGLEVKGTTKRGAYVRNVHIERSTVPRILVHSVPYNNDGDPAPTVPSFSDFSFEDINITSNAIGLGTHQPVRPIELEGFDEHGETLRALTFRHVRVASISSAPQTREILATRCSDVTFEDVTGAEVLWS